MTINVTLSNLANLTNENTAVSTINANSTTLVQAFSSALNTSGDKMLGTLDMNSNQIINLPAPATANSPARLVDITGSTPVGLLTATAGNNISISSSSSAVTISTISSPTFNVVTASTITGLVTDANRFTITLDNVSCTAVADTTINIPYYPTWRVGTIYAKGITGTFSTVSAGMFLSTGGSGATVAPPVTLSTITNVTANSSGNGTQVVGAGTVWYSASTAYLRVTSSQSGPSVANFYVEFLGLG